MSFFRYTTVTHTEAWIRHDRVIALKGRLDKQDKVEKTQIILDTGLAVGAQENPIVLAVRINSLRADYSAPPLLKLFTVKGLTVHVDPRHVILCESILPARSMVMIDGGAVFEVKAALAEILPLFADAR